MLCPCLPLFKFPSYGPASPSPISPSSWSFFLWQMTRFLYRELHKGGVDLVEVEFPSEASRLQDTDFFVSEGERASACVHDCMNDGCYSYRPEYLYGY